MCRMIAAAGRIDARSLRRALQSMASNENPAHSHENRPLGSAYRHEDGWGAAWVQGEDLRVFHDIHSCLEDPWIEAIDDLRTDLLVLHARRASRPGSVKLENTHPFLAEYRGTTWAFCHNGVIEDIGRLVAPPGLFATGDMDSELLFHHLLHHIDPAEPARSLRAGTGVLENYTALHSILACSQRAIAFAMRHPTRGLREYHALWEGRGAGVHVVSSEPLDGVGCATWRRVPDGTVVELHRPASDEVLLSIQGLLAGLGAASS